MAQSHQLSQKFTHYVALPASAFPYSLSAKRTIALEMQLGDDCSESYMRAGPAWRYRINHSV